MFCDEIDTYHAAIKAKGSFLKSAPRADEYVMRDFTITDPTAITSPSRETKKS